MQLTLIKDLLAVMSRSYRQDFTEHQIKAIIAQKNNARWVAEPDSNEDDGLTCPYCKKFCTYIYLARNAQCYNCKKTIDVNE